ncbi:hypothetical protein F2Q69_00007170 [Brassica cretica]|uniref:Uncharacterized protein n=1 Tax=Brassica cretica TaxID=69181 RepID=A0A8S9PMK2_BRACR|nr:hypothetical protein F2Q69_00007170 [Brassica cretica]
MKNCGGAPSPSKKKNLRFISNEQVLQISNDDALLLQTLGSVLHSESDPLIRARPEEVDSVGVDCKLLEDL